MLHLSNFSRLKVHYTHKKLHLFRGLRIHQTFHMKNLLKDMCKFEFLPIKIKQRRIEKLLDSFPIYLEEADVV